MHAGVSAPPPRAFNRSKHIWIRFDKFSLLFGRQLDHPRLFIGITKHCENFATHAAAASGSAERRFRIDRRIMRFDLPETHCIGRSISTNLSDLGFGGLVWFALGVLFE